MIRNLQLALLCTFSIVQAIGAEKDTSEKWSYHFQLTSIVQAHPAFNAAYSGTNSLTDTSESALSLTTTLYLGRKLWKGSAVYLNPEIAGGKGLSGARGVAGFTNGETFRIGDPSPKLYIARAYLLQHIKLGNKGTELLDADANQLGEMVPASRLDIRIGKFAVSDVLDDNNISHDPRTDFMNWSLMSNGAWDYPANTRGYTYAVALELIQPTWALRFAEALAPVVANGSKLNWNLQQSHTEAIELTKKITINKRAGNVRLLAFRNQSNAPYYDRVLANYYAGIDSLDVQNRKGYSGVKYGIGLNADQEISDRVSVFARASWNDGKTATWAFTEIEQSISAGAKISGSAWRRNDDAVGIAGVVNGISKEHRTFLAAGGYGFIIGDGALNYKPEEIIEMFYQICFCKTLYLTGDYQFILRPAYNADRGPVHVFAIRAHVAF